MLNENCQEVIIKNISNDINKFDLEDSNKKHISNSRTSCFYTLADKNILSATLARTKPCRLVIKKENSDNFGICTREECSFAHSQEELELPICMFGEKCRLVYGKKDIKTNDIIPNSSCVFKHPFENIDEWIKRTNTVIPELPKTRKESRLHLKNNLKPPIIQKIPAVEKIKQPSKEQPSKEQPSKEQPSKEQPSKEQPSKEQPSKEQPSKYFKSSYSDIIQNKQNHKEDKISIINVPSKELAQFALKSLFELGIYNVKIVVE
jgi:hypothetical protein